MKCKFYSEEIDKCLFDGPPDVCPFEDNKDDCGCFVFHTNFPLSLLMVNLVYNILFYISI